MKTQNISFYSIISIILYSASLQTPLKDKKSKTNTFKVDIPEENQLSTQNNGTELKSIMIQTTGLSAYELIEDMKIDKDQKYYKTLYFYILIFSFVLGGVNYTSLSISYKRSSNAILLLNEIFLLYTIILIIDTLLLYLQYSFLINILLVFKVNLYILTHILLIAYLLSLFPSPYYSQIKSFIFNIKILSYTISFYLLFSNCKVKSSFSGYSFSSPTIKIIYESYLIYFSTLLQLTLGVILSIKLGLTKLFLFILLYALPLLINSVIVHMKSTLISFRYDEYFTLSDLKDTYTVFIYFIFFILKKSILTEWINLFISSNDFITDSEIREFLILRSVLRNYFIKKVKDNRVYNTVDYCFKVELNKSFDYQSICEENSLCDSDCFNKSIISENKYN